MANLIWPFPSRNPSQEGRTDEGWDLTSTPGGPVLAVASGTIHKAGPDPGGFGTDYPVQILDQPITWGGQTYNAIYYGHTHMSVPPGHVTQGQTIAFTGGGNRPLGGSGSPGEVEIGFGDPNKPKGTPGSISYAQGGAMRALLLGAVNQGNGGDPGTAVAQGPGDLVGGALSGIGDTLGTIATSIAAFKNIAVWLAMPTHWVRIFAGGFGIVFVFFGLHMIVKEVQNG